MAKIVKAAGAKCAKGDGLPVIAVVEKFSGTKNCTLPIVQSYLREGFTLSAHSFQSKAV